MGSPVIRQDRSPVPSAFEYATAPESREIVRLEERYGLFIGGEWVEPSSREYVRASPARRGAARGGRVRGPGGRRSAVRSARDAFANGWSDLAPSERAKYLFRSCASCRSAREFAVLESLDGGKPIRESRDVDPPLGGALLLLRGLGRQARVRLSEPAPRPLGVAGQIIPWNFPPHALLEDRARARRGNTVVLKPAESTPLTALLFADVLRQAELPAGVVNIVTGDGRAGRGREAPGRGQDRLHGSTEVGKEIMRAVAGAGRGSRSSSAARPPTSSSTTRPRPGGRGDHQRDLLQPGSRAAPARGLVQESVYEEVLAKLKRRMGTPAWATRSTRTPTSARSTPGNSSRRSRSSSASGEEEGRRSISRPAGSREGLVVPADRLHERRAELPDRPGGDLRAGALMLTFRTPGRGGREGEQHAVRPLGRRLDREGLAHPLHGAALRAGVIWANTYNRFDPASPFGGYKESGFGREGGLHGLAPYLEFDE